MINAGNQERQQIILGVSAKRSGLWWRPTREE
jgi:hypothetical protein